MVFPLSTVEPDQHRNDEVRRKHANATAEKKLSSSKLVHAPQRAYTGDDLADVEHSGHGELHFVTKPHSFEQGRAVVDQCIDALQ